MRSHRLLRLGDNKSVPSCFINLQRVCKYQVAANLMFTDLYATWWNQQAWYNLLANCTRPIKSTTCIIFQFSDSGEKNLSRSRSVPRNFRHLTMRKETSAWTVATNKAKYNSLTLDTTVSQHCFFVGVYSQGRLGVGWGAFYLGLPAQKGASKRDKGPWNFLTDRRLLIYAKFPCKIPTVITETLIV